MERGVAASLRVESRLKIFSASTLHYNEQNHQSRTHHKVRNLLKCKFIKVTYKVRSYHNHII